MAQVVLTIPDNLLPVYTRFQVENGVTWADAYLVEKLKELALRQWTTDAEAEFAKVKPKPGI